MKLVLSICTAATLCIAQQASEVRFEVASIKPTAGREIGGSYTYPGGRVAFRGCTFLQLIELAFELEDFQITGAADWMRTERFDIDATVPQDSKSSTANPTLAKTAMNEEQRRMLQALLVERFGLKYRLDASEGPVYLLTANGKSLKMTDSKDKNAYPWSGGLRGGMIVGDGMKGINESMLDLAQRLSRYMKRPVLDRTGIAGSFDFETGYSSDGQRVDVQTMILTCLNDLGLKLEPSRGPVEKLVIEQAQRPTGN